MTTPDKTTNYNECHVRDSDTWMSGIDQASRAKASHHSKPSFGGGHHGLCVDQAPCINQESRRLANVTNKTVAMGRTVSPIVSTGHDRRQYEHCETRTRPWVAQTHKAHHITIQDQQRAKGEKLIKTCLGEGSIMPQANQAIHVEPHCFPYGTV
ncbi:hypothetical protein LZ30DRAFT_709615 [Colletotrichum cereale]|nr:hypothetical protein LZ30DRAFT_709615 [Colletotrichum cereale]